MVGAEHGQQRQEPGAQEDAHPRGSELGLHPACPPSSPHPCWFLRPQCPLPSLARSMRGPRSALPTRLGVTSTLGHSHARELEQAAAFATFGTAFTVPQGAFARQLYELATILLEGRAEICYPYTLPMTCKWTSIFITCIQHCWIPNTCSEGTRQPRQALHPLLLQDLPVTAHGRFCHPPLLSMPRTVSSHSGTAYLQPHSQEQASPFQ